MTKTVSNTAQALMKTNEVQVSIGDTVIKIRDGDILIVKAITKKGITLFSKNFDGDEYQYGDIDFKDFKNKYVVLTKAIEEYEQDLLEALKNPSSLILKDTIPSDTTALVVQNSSENILQLQSRLQAMEKHISVMTAILENKRNALQGVLRKYTEAVTKVTKVIHTLELYLGINEDIVQIGEGIPAPETEPISIRQQVLYMDEEFGDYRNGGLDFHNLEEFDAWIVGDSKNYTRVIPEAKGVVCLRVRRKDKEYSEHPITNFFMNVENHKAYFLIRNGMNFYRIWADVEVGSRIFPRKDELDPKKQGDRWGSYYEKELEEKAFTYKQKAMLLQGLIDRTEIFNPKALGLSVFKPESYKDGIRLIVDDELLLPSGRMSFRDWQQDINSKIERGTRILWTLGHNGRGYSVKDNADRFERYYREYNIPALPAVDVYSVVEVSLKDSDNASERLYSYRGCKNTGKIIYNPKDTVYDNSWKHWSERVDDHVRKKSLGIWFGFDEYFILNYDLISLEDVEFYLENRTDRPNYMEMMPILRNIKKLRLKEIEFEKQFVDAMADRLLDAGAVFANKNEVVKQLWTAVEWWKRKVIWKRPLTKDDSKAWRMIRQRVTKEMT